MKRISAVNDVVVKSVTSASSFLVGDAIKIRSRARALAVQRQVAVFFRNEGEFEDYPLFTKAIPQPIISERVNMNVVQESPFIKVNFIDVIGVSAGSTMQIGSTQIIDIQSRIKHFRQFVTSETPISQDEVIFESHGGSGRRGSQP